MAEELIDPDKAEKAHLKKLKDRLGAAAFDSPFINYWQRTGSPVLDRLLRSWRGVGGWAGGKWHDIYGPESSGKTGLCCRAAAACQEDGGKVYFINPPEQGLSTDMLDLNKVRHSKEPSDFWVCLNPFSIESCCGAIEEITLEWFDKDRPVLIIVDSVSSVGLSAYSMDSTVVGATKPSAENAKFLHEWFRRGALYYLAGSKVTILATRHQTATPRVEFGGGDHTTHGSAPDFYAWTRTKMTKKVMEDPTDSSKKGNGAWQQVTIRKNKSGRPGGVHEMPWNYSTGWDTGLEVILYLLSTGMLVKNNAHKIDYDGTAYFLKELHDLYTTSSVVRDNFNALLDLGGEHKVTKAVAEKQEKRKPGARK